LRLKVRVDGDGGYRWTMVTSCANGLDEEQPVACGVRSYPDAAACDRAARRLLSVDASAMRPVQQPDGRWLWVIDGPDGRPLAESVTAYDYAAACGYALHEVREALAAEVRHRLSASSGSST
jgi:hypothetical protein